MALELCFFIYW